ncbi:MAG: hypothetical protein AB1705_25020 [Verrucomicrobiota bacterium]
MKNVTIYVDVDLTLVDPQGRLLDGAPEGLRMLKARNCRLYLWSTAGAEYARAVAMRYQLADMFEGFASKPDIIIDDMPSTALEPFVFNPNDYATWPELAEKLLRKHVD